MNKELKFWLFISRRLPNWKVSTVFLNRIVIPFYNRKRRPDVICNVSGSEMELRPYEFLDAALLFYPHIYDAKEINYVSSLVQKDWIFVDVGAHIGFYSITFSKKLKEGRVIAIEADPGNAGRFKKNLTLNPGITNIELVERGVSDKIEVLSLGISTTGNTSGNSFLSTSSKRIDIQCQPLLDIVQNQNCQKINFLKIDIEGFEFRVFKQFFSTAPKSIFPEWILVEDNPTLVQEGNAIDLLLAHGYLLYKDFGLNKLMKHSA